MLPFSTKTQKERKGLGTSPFGALRLTPYPHPLRFCPSWETQISENTEEHREDRGTQRRAVCYRTQDA